MSGFSLQKGDLVLDATTQAQIQAADPALSIWASANAGAGKTKVLIDRIARLLLAGAEPGKILAVTYTKAAAAEMQTRLYEVLGRWTIASNAQLAAALTKLDPNRDIGLDLAKPARLNQARALFARALETPGGLKIQTIHAFCQTILQRFPLEAGVAPGFQVLDDAGANTLASQAFERATLAQPKAFLTLAAATSQAGDREIVRAAARRTEVLAAACAAEGSAFERLLAYLNLAPDATEKSIQADLVARLDLAGMAQAANVLEQSSQKDKTLAEHIRAFLSDKAGETGWDALCNTVLTQKGEAQAKQIFTKAMSKQAIVTNVFGQYDDWPSDYCLAITAAFDQRKKVRLARRSAALTEAALAWDEEWRAAKTQMGVLDFDDLLARTRALLSSRAGAAQWVLYKLDSGLEHVLIDEAQDTSPDQWALLNPLFEALENQDSNQTRTRFVVGDEKQSIYSFQGARLETFEAEKARFGADNAGKKSLSFELSFRTGQTILDAVDFVWATSQAGGAVPAIVDTRPEATLEKKYALPARHIAFRKGQGAVVELWPLVVVDKDQTEREAWDQPLNVESENSPRNQLANRIALELKARIDQGAPIWEHEQTRPMVPGDVMILVKSRGPLFHQIIKRLKFHNVPVAGADRIKLVEDAAIQDLIALARFALLPADDFNLACVLKGSFCGLFDDDAHLFELAYDRGKKTLWSRVLASETPLHVRVRTFLQSTLNRVGHLPPYEFFASILEEELWDGRTGWTAVIERLGREVREPVEAFLTRALEHGRSQAPSLQAFLTSIEGDAADVKREMEQGSAGVRVMTVHGAKGLEAPIVILPETTGAIKARDSNLQSAMEAAAFFWSPYREDDTTDFAALREDSKLAEAQEDARLLYVAMTRARDRLILCGHQSGKETKDGRLHPEACWYASLAAGLPLLDAVQAHSRTVERDDWAFTAWGAEPPPAATSTIVSSEKLRPLPDWIGQKRANETMAQRRIAPSALTPDGAEPPALSPLADNALTRFRRGRLVHELLQRLPDLPVETRAEAARLRLSRETDMSLQEQNQIADETLSVLADPAFAPLFGPDSRAEAAIVGRGAGLPADMAVNGSVDRLVVTAAEVLVLDFKTNRPPPLRVEDVAPVYLNQMAAYRALLQATWPDKTVRCALLWTDGPRLMTLPDAMLDEALNAIAKLPTS